MRDSSIELQKDAAIDRPRRPSTSFSCAIGHAQFKASLLACCAANADLVRWVRRIGPESLIQVCSILKESPQPVRSATHSGVEVDICSVHHALIRVQSLVTHIFRETLENHDFVEIHTPKLQPAATESGVAVFLVNYFGRKAFLAQSPQLAKQMAVSADFVRVFEVGLIFRAETSNTHRHLTEYIGLDIEMAINADYHEVIQLIDIFLKEVFKAVYSSRELDVIRKRWPSGELK
ncbi:hypothetical protein ACKAV7_013056 [Fusarium commune]